MKANAQLVDRFGRQIDYLRLSVTDRCNFRCTYCMPEHVQFLPKNELPSFEEIVELADIFIDHGVRHVRVTGGEPLVRKGIENLLEKLGQFVENGRLRELTMTTNGSLLEKNVDLLARSHVSRINVSLDTLEPQQFRELTRGGTLSTVLTGLEAAAQRGLAVRLNMVALPGQNEEQLLPILQYAAQYRFDIALIEEMPIGMKDGGAPASAREWIERLETDGLSIVPIVHRTSGPARYYRAEELGVRIGVITPMSENFCASCNRIRLTADGKVFPCLGSELSFDLKQALRHGGRDAVEPMIAKLLGAKPERHDFVAQYRGDSERLQRHMNATGG